MFKQNPTSIFKDSYDFWIFDLDNTLYDINLGVFKKISKRMTKFIINELELDEDKAKTLQKEMFLKYGLTLRGLIVEKKINPDRFLNYVHDVDHPELERDNELISLLKNLNGKKYIYTNAPYSHAKKILNVIGAFDLFDDILDIKKTDYIPKPDLTSFEIMQRKFGISFKNVKKSIFIEDTVKNLKPAKQIGMSTVWIENKLNCEEFKKDFSFVDYSFKNVKSFLKFVKY
tara:strand:+ start:340 stop:1029 length:690 start_codon:yes stop_codon:yes gene_type:complete